MAKRAYDIKRDYQSTGNRAIDGVASCIMWHQERGIPLRAVHLTEKYYDMFKKGIEIIQGHPFREETALEFNHVIIEKGSRFQQRAIMPEEWNSQQ